ncbi:MAG: hypothetical protein ACTS9Y_00060 [Methylophilus sp.]|uniref:hypothetical protein n=1 Tax=Methylophilus sp. TaxID=29541 RepID=UPI003F9F9A74
MSVLPNKHAAIAKCEPKNGFNVGWDWYAYRLKVPDNASGYAAFMEGYNAAKAARVSPLDHDRFSRKIMLLRLNAWKRGRIFSDEVTTKFLKSIDSGKCPVTGVDLTHGTITENDWSVDRINNNGGYVPGNLVIMSTKANTCKGDKSFPEMWELGYGGQGFSEVIEGLTVYEWRRMVLICSCVITDEVSDDDGEIHFGYAIAPAISLIPRNIVVNGSIVMQTEIALAAAGYSSKMYDRITSGFRKSFRKEFNALKNDCGKEIQKARLLTPYDVWNKLTLFRRFKDLYTDLATEERLCITAPFLRLQTPEDLPNAPDAETWGLNSDGYVLKQQQKVV